MGKASHYKNTMQCAPTLEEFNWLQKICTEGTINGSKLSRPAHLYRYTRNADGTLSMTPMTTIDLMPATRFTQALTRLVNSRPESRPHIKHMSQCNLSNLVMHGATYSDRTLPLAFRSGCINGNHGKDTFQSLSKKQTILSSDQSGGTPSHTRLTVHEQRKAATSDAFCPPQQIMSFSNPDQRPPHQVRN